MLREEWLSTHHNAVECAEHAVVRYLAMVARRVLWATCLALAFLASSARAQSDVDVTAARKLFTEAVKDEESGQFEVALGKFRKVQAVRDTAAVRFRVGACLEALGQLREAQKVYASAADAASADPSQKELVTASRDKAEAIARRMPTLTLTLSPKAPSDAVVLVDEKPVAPTDLGRPLPLDPGAHKVAGRATGVPPYATDVTLSEGAGVSLSVPLDVALAAPPPPVEPAPSPALGWALIGAGAGLLVASGVTVIVRQNAIATVEDACPGNRCPEARRGEVVSAQDRAKAMVPVGIACGLLGAVSAGVGGVLLYRSTMPRSNVPPAAARLVPQANGFALTFGGPF